MSTALTPPGSGRHAHAPAARWPARRRFALLALLMGMVGVLCLLPSRPPAADNVGMNADVDALQARTGRADDLAWLRAEMGTVGWPAGRPTRSELVREKDRL